MMQPSEFTSENVVSFPVREVLQRFLGDLYDISVVQMDSVAYGLPVARLRSYQVGRHRGKTMHPCKSLQDHCVELQRPCAFGWHEFFWLTNSEVVPNHNNATTAIQNELMAEWTWASNRPTSRLNIKKQSQQEAGDDDEANGGNICAGVLHDSPDGPMTGQVGLDFEIALTQTEYDNALTYHLRWPVMCYSLNQSAEEHGNKSTSRYLQTFIRNFGLMFTFSKKIGKPRWLCASEALVAMGFPLHPNTLEHRVDSRAFLLTSFNAPRPERKPDNVRSQCGNSDSLLLASVSELYNLIYVRHHGCICNEFVM